MSAYERAREAADSVRARLTRTPGLAVVLGSGLAGLADRLEGPVPFAYRDLPNWPQATVAGHEGRLVVGELRGQTVAVLSGRVHAYEGYDPQTVTLPVRVLGLLGVRTLILTNSSGGIRRGIRAGQIAAIEDHLNLTGSNPLVGDNDDRFGPRFPDMTEVYSRRLRMLAEDAARAVRVPLAHGVYAGVLGPSYETPAEIRWLSTAGADMVGMSTVWEAIAARHMRMEVLGLSCVTNAAAGVEGPLLSHEDVLQTARETSAALAALVEEIVART